MVIVVEELVVALLGRQDLSSSLDVLGDGSTRVDLIAGEGVVCDAAGAVFSDSDARVVTSVQG
jgi:hypothetical protein